MVIKNKIKAFLGKFMEVDSVGEDDNIFEKGLVSSLFAMQLVTFLEKSFDIAINNEELDLENFKSINCITNLVKSKQ